MLYKSLGAVWNSCPKSNINVNVGINSWIEMPNCNVWKYWGICIHLQIWVTVLNFNRWQVLNRLTTVSVISVWQDLICFNLISSTHDITHLQRLIWWKAENPQQQKSTTPNHCIVNLTSCALAEIQWLVIPRITQFNKVSSNRLKHKTHIVKILRKKTLLKRKQTFRS